MPRLLIVDDDIRIRDVIHEYAEVAGYEAEEAGDGLEAVNLCRNKDYDVIVMDLMMPKMDGFWAVKEIRKYKSIPILILSAKGEEYDKLHGFDLGIDDYVVKPFSPKEIIARLDVMVRRNAAAAAAANAAGPAGREMPAKSQFEGLEVDVPGRNVHVDGKKVDMTPKEFDLLVCLIRNRNTVIARDTLLSEVWGYDYFGDDRTVDTHIKMLRNSLGEYRKFIVTSRGAGYKFETA